MIFPLLSSLSLSPFLSLSPSLSLLFPPQHQLYIIETSAKNCIGWIYKVNIDPLIRDCFDLLNHNKNEKRIFTLLFFFVGNDQLITYEPVTSIHRDSYHSKENQKLHHTPSLMFDKHATCDLQRSMSILFTKAPTFQSPISTNNFFFPPPSIVTYEPVTSIHRDSYHSKENQKLHHTPSLMFDKHATCDLQRSMSIVFPNITANIFFSPTPQRS